MSNSTVSSSTDLLLLNVSNYPGNPIYPYAFIQVSAVARQYGVNIQTLDLFQIPERHWIKTLKEKIRNLQPKMIGVTLRQVDSLIEAEYLVSGKSYLPAKKTKQLIQIIRKICRLPLVVGGFGFSTYAEDLMTYLQPDFGIVGEPDHFFERWSDILNRSHLESISNLHYWTDTNSLNKLSRKFFGPLNAPEYTESSLKSLVEFYPAKKEICAPIEVQRGCPMRCYFCSEPAVKGLKIQKRNLNIVFRDIEFIVTHSRVRRFWMVASELNIASDELFKEICHRMIEIKNRFAAKDIQWFGYLLPKIKEPALYQLAVKSGHVWSWNEVQSFDSENLKSTRVPYKVDEAIDFFRHMLTIHNSSTQRPAMSFFMGNAFSKPETLIKTLQIIENEKFAGKFGRSILIAGTRIFPSRAHLIPDHEKRIVYSRVEKGLPPGSLIRPTFYHAPEFLKIFKSPLEIMRFFHFISGTFITLDKIGPQAPQLVKLFRQLFTSPKDRAHFTQILLVLKTSPAPSPWFIAENVRSQIHSELKDEKKIKNLIRRLLKAPKNNIETRQKIAEVLFLILISHSSEAWRQILTTLLEKSELQVSDFGSFKNAQHFFSQFADERKFSKHLRLLTKNNFRERQLLRIFKEINGIRLAPEYQRALTP